MNILHAAILGVIQGLAEFLPISSSGHLEVAQRLMGLQADSMDMMLLTVLLHAGTLTAVIVVFWEDWIGILKNLFHSRLLGPFRVPAVLLLRSAGFSSCCPSTTLFSLALGPDLPRADQLYPGNLRYSAERILTFLSLLIPAFSLQNSPLLLIGTASSCFQCSSTNVYHS